MRNIRMEIGRSFIHQARRHSKDPVLNKLLDEGLENIDLGTYVYEQRIEESKMIGVRNPAFDGDMVGWLDDDFDYDDKDETDDKDDKPKQ